MASQVNTIKDNVESFSKDLTIFKLNTGETIIGISYLMGDPGFQWYDIKFPYLIKEIVHEGNIVCAFTPWMIGAREAITGIQPTDVLIVYRPNDFFMAKYAKAVLKDYLNSDFQSEFFSDFQSEKKPLKQNEKRFNWNPSLN